MRLKESITDKDLQDLGFERIDKNDDHDFVYAYYDWALNLGHSRRAQFYYVLIKDRNVSIYASNPDGSGASIPFPSILCKIVNILDTDDTIS